MSAEHRDPDVLDTLLSLRDWLRYATSRFTEAGLVFGHGTTTALDEAAFLILSTLHLPIDQLDPWLDARLTRAERERVAAIIEARITTRKPAPYLTGTAWIRGRKFLVDERVIVPRSFIGEFLCAYEAGEDPASPFATLSPGIERVLDLCTGGGSLAILAAEAFPAARIDAVDLSPDALAVAAKNVAAFALEDRILLVQSDLFAALAGRRYDLIISNPPYVTDASLAAFPPEYRAEPRMAHAGGRDGLDLVRRIIAEAGSHLKDDGMLVVEIGQARPNLMSAHPHMPFVWHDTAESAGEVFSLTAADFASKPVKKKRGKG